MKLETLVEMVKKTVHESRSKKKYHHDMRKRYKPDQKLAEDDKEKDAEIGKKSSPIELNPQLNSINQAR